MSGTISLPLVMAESGPTPTDPQTILSKILALATSLTPLGYTGNLPGSLIDDVSGTDTAAVSLMDSARVELVMSLTPLGANPYLLNLLGQVYGVPQGTGTNTSVNVVFSGPPGYVISPGFTVSDGSYNYVVQDPVTIGTLGASQPAYCVASIGGSWVVPANTVVNLATAVSQTLAPPLTVTNPLAGTPATAAQSEGDYRTAVLQAGLAQCAGMPTMLRKALTALPGVVERLVSIQAQVGGGWEVIVGGGDPYQIAGAIYANLFDVSQLVGSSMNITGVTQGAPTVFTTNLDHNFTVGQLITITGMQGMTNFNGIQYPVSAIVTPTQFSINVDSTAFPAYTGGGTITPNPRNQTPTIIDTPDSYVVPFVLPPQQLVNLVVTWNTSATNIVSADAVSQLATTALTNYINGIYVGQPINLFEMQAVFQQAVVTILATPLLTRLVFSVSINGVGAAPVAGTGIIEGDPESYFVLSSLVVEQG